MSIERVRLVVHTFGGARSEPLRFQACGRAVETSELQHWLNDEELRRFVEKIEIGSDTAGNPALPSRWTLIFRNLQEQQRSELEERVWAAIKALPTRFTVTAARRLSAA